MTDTEIAAWLSRIEKPALLLMKFIFICKFVRSCHVRFATVVGHLTAKCLFLFLSSVCFLASYTYIFFPC